MSLDAFRAMSMMAAGEHFSLENLEAIHPNLLKQLRGFDKIAVLAAVGGLQTVPELHANTIRFEILGHLAASHASGNKKPQSIHMHRWLNLELKRSGISVVEDPSEDVFLGNVVTPGGNRRIYRGIWESGDIWLQQILDVLVSAPDHPEIERVKREVAALIRLSEAIAERAGTPRFAIGSGTRDSNIQIPAQKALAQLMRRVTFSLSDLTVLGIAYDHLAAFVLDTGSIVQQESIGHSSLERRPLVRNGDQLVIAIPSAIGAAIRRYILEEFDRIGALPLFASVLRHLQRDSTFDRALGKLHAVPLTDDKLPKKPDLLGCCDQVVCMFDEGKYAHVILVSDELDACYRDGLVNPRRLPADRTDTFLLYLCECANTLSSEPDYSGGLTVLVFGGVGRGILLPLPAMPDKWELTEWSLPDFLMLGWDESMNLLRLWKMRRHVSFLSASGVEVPNTNGDVNLYSYWRRNFRLIPKDFEFPPPGNGILTLEIDFVAGFRQKVRQTCDEHGAFRSATNSWVRVERLNVHSFFREMENQPIYIAPEYALAGELLGLVETSNRSWWLRATRPGGGTWPNELVWRLWEGLLAWLRKVAVVFEETPAQLPPGPIEISFEVEELSSWTEPVLDDLPAVSQPVTFGDCKNNRVNLRIPLGYIRLFNVPENQAEMGLVEAIAAGARELCSNPEVIDAAAIAHRVIPDSGARSIHFFARQTIRDHFSINAADARLVFPEDAANSWLGLAWTVRESGDHRSITGVTECVSFLNDTANAVRLRIEGRLRSIDRVSFLLACLKNLDAIERDRTQWQRTAQAVLALHSDLEDVHRAALNRESRRNGASISSRVLAEMALCTCPLTGGHIASSADFDAALADMEVLITCAHDSDAIYSGFITPNVDVFRNGGFSVDGSFFETIVNPYSSGQFRENFEDAAEAYATLYENPPVDVPGSQRSLPGDFVAAFTAEFGLSPSDCGVAALAAFELAQKTGSLIVRTTSSALRTHIESSGLSSLAADAFINSFALSTRSRWDRAPAGFGPKDWWPWRFGRRLSLIARPLLQVDESSDSVIVYTPGMVEDSLRHVTSGAYHGRLGKDFFRTPEMRSWIGRVNDKQGHEFNREVALHFEQCGWNALPSVKMRKLGAPQRLGDIDVLAWSPDRTVVLAVECKRLHSARTVGEIAAQLRRFQGTANDDLAVHLDRYNWLNKNREAVARETQLASAEFRLDPLLVTNTIVPMQFTKGLPLASARIVPLHRLGELLKQFE